MKKLLLVPLVILLVCGLILSGCAAPAPTTPAPAPTTPAPAPTTPAPAPTERIKIGALADLTGPFAEWGMMIKAGLELGFDEIGWKILGRPVELLMEDTASPDTSLGLEKTKKLVERDKVPIILGPVTSAMQSAVTPYLTDVKIPSIRPTEATREELSLGWKYDIKSVGIFQDASYPTGVFVAEELGWKTATAIAVDYSAGKDFVQGFVEGFEDKGGTVIQKQWTPVATMDYGPYLIAMKNADGIAEMVVTPGDMQRLVQQATEFGILKKMPIMMATNIGELGQQGLDELGSLALGLRCGSGYCATDDNPANNKFVAAYRAKFAATLGDIPSELVVRAYENVFLLKAMLEATGGDTNPDKLVEAVVKLKFDDFPSGHLYFTPDLQGRKDRFIKEVKKIGDQYRWELVKTYPAMTR